MAGNYDAGPAAALGAREAQAASGIAGVVGFMYTTWFNDYSGLKAYAEAVRANHHP